MKTKSPFLNHINDYMLLKQYYPKTVSTYLKWISAFIHFHGKRRPSSMGDNEVEHYLEHLALNANVSPRTQATALNSLSFLYKYIIRNELSLNLNFARSKRQPKLPVVMAQNEVKLLMSELNKRDYLIAGLMYGSGLRSIEAVQLRVQDIDFDYKYLRVWNGKGKNTESLLWQRSELHYLKNK